MERQAPRGLALMRLNRNLQIPPKKGGERGHVRKPQIWSKNALRFLEKGQESVDKKAQKSLISLLVVLELDGMRCFIVEATQLSSYALHVGGDDRRDGEQDSYAHHGDTFNDSIFNDHTIYF